MKSAAVMPGTRQHDVRLSSALAILPANTLIGECQAGHFAPRTQLSHLRRDFRCGRSRWPKRWSRPSHLSDLYSKQIRIVQD